MAPADDGFDLAPHIDAVTEMVQAASRRSLEWYRRVEQIDNKWADRAEGGFDPVTEADRAVEADLRSRLESRFPGHAIYGEEFGTTGDGPYRWTIDPIDGTRAFITGQPMWGTLLGFQVDGRPIAGWMHVPPLDETFVGFGTGRLLTPQGVRELRVSKTEALPEAVVLCTDPSMFAPGEQTERFDRVVDAVKLVRYAGDCLNYGLLAMGLVDSVVENGLAPYDIIPLIPIVEAAGGIVTDLDGRSPVDGGFVVASATEALHAATIELLTGDG